MEFFRLRPQATFGITFFACSLLISYYDADYTVPTAVMFVLFLGVLTAALVKWRSATADAKQTLAALLSLFLAPVLALGLAAYRDSTEPVFPDGEAEVLAVVRTRLSSSAGYEQYIVDVRCVDGKETDFAAVASGYGLSLEAGDMIGASADISPVSAHCRGDDRYLRSRGAIAEMELSGVRPVGRSRGFTSFVGALREEISSRIRSCVGESAPLVTALVTGERGGLDGALRRSFSDIGIPHLLAISGLHLGVVTACISFAVRGLRRKRYFVIVPAILLYAAISGFSASVVRATAMALIVCFAEIIGRRGDPVSVISLAVTVIILVSPGAVYDVGFLLSVLCVFALALLSHLKDARHGAVDQTRATRNKSGSLARPVLDVFGRILRTAAKSVAATVAITVVTLPVTASEFGTLALVSPLADLIFIPLFSLLICAALILVILAFVPGLGTVVGGVVGMYAAFLTRLVTRFDHMFGDLSVSLNYPFFGVLSVLVAVSFVLMCISRRPRGFAVLTLALVCSMIASATVTRAMRADVVSVTFRAQGGSDLISVTDGSVLYVIDSARPSSTLRRRLEEEMRSAYVTRIGAYVFTHYHPRSDVYLRRLLENVRVDRLILPAPQNDDERELCMSMARISLDADCVPELAGDTVMLGDVSLTLLSRCEIALRSESLVALMLSCGDESVAYLGRGYSDIAVQNAAALPDSVVIGSHGAKEAAVPAFSRFPANLTTLTSDSEEVISWKKIK